MIYTGEKMKKIVAFIAAIGLSYYMGYIVGKKQCIPDKIRAAEVSYMIGCITSPTPFWTVSKYVENKIKLCEDALKAADLPNLIGHLDERRKRN
jgi:hypothetical protein